MAALGAKRHSSLSHSPSILFLFLSHSPVHSLVLSPLPNSGLAIVKRKGTWRASKTPARIAMFSSGLISGRIVPFDGSAVFDGEQSVSRSVAGVSNSSSQQSAAAAVQRFSLSRLARGRPPTARIHSFRPSDFIMSPSFPSLAMSCFAYLVSPTVRMSLSPSR